MKHFFRIIVFPVLIAVIGAALLQSHIQEFANAALKVVNNYFHNNLTENLSQDNINNHLDTKNHLFATEMSVSRTIRKVFLAREQAEGAGARVRRSIGTPQLRNFSPFLMLDHFSVSPGAGFPDQ